MQVAVIGCGYVGLVTGACLAQAGHVVAMVDVDAARIAGLQRGEVPFYEADLDRVVRESAGRMRFSTDASSVAAADVVFLAVPTPPADDGSCDTSTLFSATASLARHLRDGAVVVVKSTVPPGTTDRVASVLRDHGAPGVFTAMNPEFLREGSAVSDFRHPDRVVVGSRHREVEAVMERLYDGFVDVDRPLLFMDPVSAELCKYAANTWLAMRIAYINEIASLTEVAGGDIDAVRRAIGADARIGVHYLHPGPGYGGTCFPKDVRALAHVGRSAGRPLELAEATHRANDAHRRWVVQRVRTALGTPLVGRRLAVWGLAFKANSDDVRESIALDILADLAGTGVEVCAYDPKAGARELGPRAAGVARFAADPLDAATGADVVAVLTEWPEFASVDLGTLAGRMRGRVLVDARNLLRPGLARAAGLDYLAVGKRGS